MDSVKQCPNCMIEITCQNRLIFENCGHSKCRKCFILEENGCKICNQNSNNVKEKIIIVEDRQIFPVATINHQLKKPTLGKSKIPPHIVKEDSTDNEVSYLCTICNKRFKSRTQQYYHLYCDNTANKPFQCGHCSKKFSSSSHLKNHIGKHSQNSFKCSICFKKFSHMQTLKRHEQLHSAIVQECSECGKKIKDKQSFASHMQKHQNILPHGCNQCDKKFSQRSSLLMHQKTIHKGTQQFKCNQCSKVFNRNSSLKMHLLRHSQDLKYTCNECFKKFIDRKSLVRHSLVHDRQFKYKCILCDTISTRKDNIQRHIKNMHPDMDKNCMEVINEGNRVSNEKSLIEYAQPEEVPTTQYSLEEVIVPVAIENSSVIRCIGNVKPVTIPQEKDLNLMTEIIEEVPPPPPPVVINTNTTSTEKKVKKKFDPYDIYRKILLDDDSSEENDTNNTEDIQSPEADQTKHTQESTIQCNGQQSNFSETHWRKNFKYTYQFQFD